MAGLGWRWYGPLIDLSSTSSYIDQFIQLLVFVHRSDLIQYKLARGGNVIRTDIHVGDETRPFFAVSIWNKQLAASVSAGDVILLQNVKVVKFGSMIEARTVQSSSILRLVHPYNSMLSKGVEELMVNCRVTGGAKNKLRRVIEWVQRSRPSLCNKLKTGQIPALRNWKPDDEQNPRECYLLSEVLHLQNPCKVIFQASVGEIFLPSAWNDSDRERMFISRRLASSKDCVVEDMIRTGCQLCGSPLNSDSECAQKASFFHCKKSSNQLHNLGLIYRPFMLYVWDKSDYIPLLVQNKAAEILFGNIKAEKVHKSYTAQKTGEYSSCVSNMVTNENKCEEIGNEVINIFSTSTREKKIAPKCPDFYAIWLILVKMLLFQGKNSPFQFEVVFTPSLKVEDGRFEMIGMKMSCLIDQSISENQELGF